MRVREIDTSLAGEVRSFVRFPFRLYDNHPVWVPRMVSDVRFALDRSGNPFYEESDAAFFVVKRLGSVVGRVAVLDHSPFNECHQSDVAFFYFFDAAPDMRAAKLLFEAAFDWARQRGLDRMIGPLGMQAGDGHGILVDGFDRRPGMSIPWNYPYYERLLAHVGFEKLVDSFSAQIQIDQVRKENSEHLEKIRDIAERVRARRNLWIMAFGSKREAREQMCWLVPELRRIYNSSFADLPLFYPLDEAGMQRVVNRFLAVADLNLVRFVMKGADLVGFVLAYPNITPGIRRAGGRLWPLGWFHLLLERRRTRWLDVNGIGILPKFQGTGANVVLYAELARILEETDFEWAILNQVSEENAKNLRELAGFGVGEFDRVHRVYQRPL